MRAAEALEGTRASDEIKTMTAVVRDYVEEIDQIIEQFCGDLDHVRAGIGGWRKGFHFRRCKWRQWRGNLRLSRVAEIPDRLDQRVRWQRRLLGSYRVEHLRQAVVAALQQRK